MALTVMAVGAVVASPVAVAGPPELATPNQPTISMVTTSSMKLNWTAVPGADSYRLYWGTNPDGTGRTRHDVTAATTTTISGMRPGTRYYVRMAARTDEGTSSAYAADVDATTSALIPPEHVQVDQVMATSMRVTWDEVPGVSTYRLYYGTNPDGTGRTRVDVVGRTAVTLGFLRPETTYYVRMAARTPEGESSAYTADVSGTPTRTLATPGGITVSAVSANSAKVSWGQVASADSYRLYWGTNPDGTGRHRIDTGSTSATIPGLQAGVRYYVRIASRRVDGSSSTYSSDATWRTIDTFGTPTDVTIDDVSATTMTLSWSAVSGAATYRLYYGTNPDGTGRTRLDVAHATTATISGLAPSTRYYVRMAAREADGTSSAYTDDVSLPTQAAGGFVPPPNLQIEDVGSRHFKVTWSSVSGVAGYRLYWGTKSDGTGRTRVDVDGEESTSTVIAGVVPQTKYYVRIASRNSSNKMSSYTPDRSATTAAVGPVNDIGIASYNVRANNAWKTDGHPWPARRQAVWDTINSRQPDVVGLQEASQSALDGTSTRDKKFYFKDVVSGLPGYRLTDESAYNCAHDWSPMQWGDNSKRCYGDQVVDQGASGGSRIAYNSATMRMVTSGSKLLSDVSETQWNDETRSNPWSDKYMAWAVLERRESGKRMFFVSAHLRDGEDRMEVRAQQSVRLRSYVDQLNTANLPVVIVGDFNVYPFQNAGADYNAIIKPFKDAGYRDPLGTQANTIHRATTGLADSIIGHPNCDSFTGFRRKLPLGTDPIDGQKDCWWSGYDQTHYNGNNIDYIFTRRISTIKLWETVIDMDGAGNIRGVIPSDHNMIRTVVTLP